MVKALLMSGGRYRSAHTAHGARVFTRPSMCSLFKLHIWYAQLANGRKEICIHLFSIIFENEIKKKEDKVDSM